MEYLLRLALLATIVPFVFCKATCPPPQCQGGAYGLVANALRNFQPAQSFCSSKFPLPTQTCIAPASTIYVTVSTSIVSTTVTTTTTTSTAPPSVITTATTSTPTTLAIVYLTTTTTVPAVAAGAGAKAKRGDPRAAQLSSLKNKASSFVGGVCSCLETPASTTSTPSTTVRVTATTTTSITVISATTTTPLTTTTNFVQADPITVTVSEVATTTTTAQAVQTFIMQANYAPAQQPNNNIYGFTTPLNGQANFIDFTSDPTAATVFSLDPDSHQVTATTGTASGDLAFYSQDVGSSSFVLVSTTSYANSQGGTPILCSVSTSQGLACDFKGTTGDFWLCGGHLNLVQAGYDFTNTCSAGVAVPVTITALPQT